jgi:gentisate 1,2-dioxygenase
MPTPPAGPATETPERLAFYERIGQKHLTPLWTSLSKLVTPEPVTG